MTGRPCGRHCFLRRRWSCPPNWSPSTQLLDDPRFFEPFRKHFDPRWGRPSIPIETYLRLMFLKYRYRLGYETLCAEVTDSLSWLRFARIPIGGSAPHPTTLMKITTRCGPALIEQLNVALLAKAVQAGVVEMDWLRADTTVVPADIKYPTDSGLLVKGITKTAGLVERIHAAGVAPRTLFDDRTADARQAAHRIGSKLRRRSDEAKAEVLAITGELADLAETAVEQAKRVLVNARRVADRPVKSTSSDARRSRSSPRRSRGDHRPDPYPTRW